MEICVVGAGAIGSIIASRFDNVSIIARSNYHEIKANGIFIESDSWGSYHFSCTTYSSTETEFEKELDYVIITTKALPDQFDISIYKRLISPKTVIILIQNGIGIEDEFLKEFPMNPIVSSVAYIAASHDSGKVKQTGFHHFFMGLHTKNGMKELQIFLDLGRSKGLDLRGPCEDIQSYRWQKLLWNCSFNSLSILCGELTCDVMLQDPDCVALVRSIMVEVTEAAERVLKKPFPKEFDSIDRLLEITKKIGKYKPSMLLDWQAKRPLEIQVILGNPIEIAKKHGYTMAHLQTIFHMLKVKLHTRSS